MKKHYMRYVLLLFSFSLVLFGCQEEPDSTPVNSGVVELSDAYVRHFGTLPPAKAGRAYANVGYLPLKDNPEKVGPLPIFLFTPENRLKNVLEKLISSELTLTQKSNYQNPFPDDLRMDIRSTGKLTLILDLSTSRPWNEKKQRAAANALKETAFQFDGIQMVKIYSNQKALPDMPSSGYRHDTQLISETPPPSIILMAGTWESHQEEPEEIQVGFDRPVKFRSFDLFHQDGRKVEGSYYTSIFQMAVIIHPTKPELFKEGTMLKAKWSVVDFQGRENSGIDSFRLKKYVH